ncbi:MAG: GNAT family N-acetyltransferase [Turneriella sp.]
MTRQATEDDAKQIAELLKPHVESKVLLHRSTEEIKQNLDKTLVDVDVGRVVGTVSLVFFTPSLCEIRALAISPATQGHGIGKRLVLAAEQMALSLQTERPMRFFALTYTPEFFERCGYARTTKDMFPEKIYEVCNFCLRKDDCHEIAVQKTVR